MSRAVAILVITFGLPRGATAQQASAGLSPAEVTVGDVLHAVLIARVPVGGQVAFPDSLELSADLERVGPPTLVVDTLPDGQLEWRAAYPLVAWRPGSHALPPAEVSVRIENAVRTAHLAIGTLVVRSVLPADTTGIEPKPAKDVLGASRVWWLWPLAILLALLLAAALLWAYRRLRPRVQAAVAAAQDPREAALRALDDAAGLLERGETKRFYIAVSEALRHYLAQAEPGLGPDLTTTELAGRANHGGALDPALLVLRSADLVKFARRRPGPEEATTDWQRARDWVAAFPPPPEAEEEAA